MTANTSKRVEFFAGLFALLSAWAAYEYGRAVPWIVPVAMITNWWVGKVFNIPIASIIQGALTQMPPDKAAALIVSATNSMPPEKQNAVTRHIMASIRPAAVARANVTLDNTEEPQNGEET